MKTLREQSHGWRISWWKKGHSTTSRERDIIRSHPWSADSRERMQHDSVSRISTRIYVLRSEQKRTFFNKEQEKTWHFLVEMRRSDQMMREEETSKRMYPSRPSRERVSSGNWPNKLKITIYIILNLKQDRKQIAERYDLKEDDRIK